MLPIGSAHPVPLNSREPKGTSTGSKVTVAGGVVTGVEIRITTRGALRSRAAR